MKGIGTFSEASVVALIVLEEDDRKCEGLTRRCEFRDMKYGTVCDGSVVALSVYWLSFFRSECECLSLVSGSGRVRV